MRVREYVAGTVDVRGPLRGDQDRDDDWMRRQAAGPGEGDSHIVDHKALWEALIYLNRRVLYLEGLLEGEDED